MAKRKVKKTKTNKGGMYLVSWRNMHKGSDLPLPMRPFGTYQEAETYILGCADVICVASKDELDHAKVLQDFVITMD